MSICMDVKQDAKAASNRFLLWRLSETICNYEQNLATDTKIKELVRFEYIREILARVRGDHSLSNYFGVSIPDLVKWQGMAFYRMMRADQVDRGALSQGFHETDDLFSRRERSRKQLHESKRRHD